MRANERFILRTIADESLLIPTGSAALEVKGLISLSESGAVLYRKLQTGCTEDDLVTELTSEYDVDRETARADVTAFLGQMRKLGILEEDQGSAL